MLNWQHYVNMICKILKLISSLLGPEKIMCENRDGSKQWLVNYLINYILLPVEH